jgi:hypothetical protein
MTSIVSTSYDVAVLISSDSSLEASSLTISALLDGKHLTGSTVASRGGYMCGSDVRHSMILGVKYVTLLIFARLWSGPDIRCLRLADVVALCNPCVRRLPKGPARHSRIEGQSGLGIAR